MDLAAAAARLLQWSGVRPRVLSIPDARAAAGAMGGTHANTRLGRVRQARRSAAGAGAGIRLGIALAGLLSASPALAAEDSGPRRCAVATALGELTPDERDALARTCEGLTAPEEALQSAIFRVASMSGWRSAALAPLLAPARGGPGRLLRRPGAAPPDLQRAQASLVLRPEALAGPNCADLRRAVEDFVRDAQAGEAAASPFLHDDPALARCVGGDAEALRTTRLVALRASNVEELFVAAAAPDFAWATWLQPRDALTFGRHRFFVVAAPPGAPLTAVARLTNAEVPAVWHEIVAYDEVAWAESPALTCIDLDVRLGTHAQVYVDGAAIPRDESGVSRVLTVTRQDHEIVALECPPDDAPCHVRYREQIPANALQRRANQCLGVRLDLAARARPTVAILDATQGQSCGEAPLRADGLRRGAADHLSSGPPSAGHDFRDLAAFAAATDALSALRVRLHPIAGAATGPDNGADGSDLLGTAAKEAWRQGIDVLLSFDLQCVRREDAWIYRLTATRFALSSMFSRGRYGGRSLDLGSFIESSVEEFRALDRLPVALAGVIDRSLSVPYLRLLADAPTVAYRRGAELLIQSHTGGREGASAPECGAACRGRAVVVRARQLTLASERPELCRRLEQTIAPGPALLAEAQRAFDAGRGKPLDLPLSPDRADGVGRLNSRSDRTHLRGRLPGWYLVLARWDGDTAPRAATCVELAAPPREVWADLAVSIGSLHIVPRPGPEQLYARLRLGYTQYLRPILGVGVFAGYAYSEYAWSGGRPAWQDLAVKDGGPLEWQRHALLIGGLVELRTRAARLPFDLRLRVAPTLSAGFLRLGRIPAGFTQFLGKAAEEFDVDLDLHIDAVVGYDIGRVALQHVLLLGLHAVDDSLRRAPNTLGDDGAFFIGLGLGIGGAP